MPAFDIESVLADLRRQHGDTAGVEVKSARGGLPSTVGESLCALANHPGGGLLLLGLDEQAGFAPVGLTGLQTLKQGIASKASVLPGVWGSLMGKALMISASLAPHPCYGRTDH